MHLRLFTHLPRQSLAGERVESVVQELREEFGEQRVWVPTIELVSSLSLYFLLSSYPIAACFFLSILLSFVSLIGLE